jgi:thioredoxin reductase (NADPH)
MRREIELAVIGAGIAGVSAAVYAKRAGLEFLVFEPLAVGGQLLLMEDIDNYVGLKPGSKGRDFAGILSETLESAGIALTKIGISRITAEGDRMILDTSDCSYAAKAVIAATGATFAKLGFKGEAAFTGKGVSYCAICDGFFFKGKNVVVVGGGNTAVEEALYLAEFVNKVILIHRRGQLRAMDYLQKRLRDKDNIEVIFDSVVKEAKGEDALQSVVIENTKTGQSQVLAAAGLFVAIGAKPNTEVFTGLVSQDQKGFIITDEEMKSSSYLIWACGDCRRRPLRQLITAAAEGAIAALSAYKYLKGRYVSV